MHVTCSCIRILSFLSICSIGDVFLFSLSLSLCAFLSLSFSDRLRMAPKPKSTPTWNPLGSRSSSSDPPVPPLHVWFRDGKAQQDFLENFQKHGVHPECHVVLSHFSDTPLPAVIQTQGWESLYKIPLRCPIMFIQEFYSNIHGIDTFVPRFATTFWGTCIVVTPNLISKVPHVPWVLHLDYHGYQCLQTVSKEELLSHFYKTPSTWGRKQNTLCLGFAKGLRFLKMVVTFVLTLLSHYNSITELRAWFLLSFLKDLSIDFASHFITSILDVYQDMATCNKLIFPSAIMQILHHFSILILDSPYFTIIGAIDASSVWWNKAQFRLKRPRVLSTGSTASAITSSFAPSSSVGDVTLNAIMAQLQCMDAHLDTFSYELSQVNTHVGRIAWRNAHLGGFTASPSPSLKASTDEDVEDSDDVDTNSSSDDEMTTSQWLTLCHSWQKGEVVLGWE